MSPAASRKTKQRVDLSRAQAKSIRAALGRVMSEMSKTVGIEDIIHKIGFDHTGDESVFVTVIVASDASEYTWRGSTLNRIARKIHSALEDEEVDLWPYVSFESN